MAKTSDKKTKKIELTIPENFRNAIIFEARRVFNSDNITLEGAILRILEKFIRDAEKQLILEEDYFEEPLADAYTLSEGAPESDFAVPALEAGILDPDFEINWLEPNGNALENRIRIKAQVCDILESKDYAKLGKKLAIEISKFIQESRREPSWDSIPGWSG